MMTTDWIKKCSLTGELMYEYTLGKRGSRLSGLRVKITKDARCPPELLGKVISMKTILEHPKTPVQQKAVRLRIIAGNQSIFTSKEDKEMLSLVAQANWENQHTTKKDKEDDWGPKEMEAFRAFQRIPATGGILKVDNNSWNSPTNG